jgi:uncharacterized protein (DUF58 family)
MEDNQQASDQRQPMIQGPLSRMHRAILWRLATALGDEEQFDSSQVREYQIGDAAGHVGWNSSARADRPYVRDSYEEQALDVWLLLDLSASSEWGKADYLKRDRAIEFAAVVGQLFGQQGTPIGGLLFAEHALHFVAAGAGYQHLLQSITSIQMKPRQNIPSSMDLGSALLQTADLIPRHSLLLIVSDFLGPNSWQLALRQLARHNEVVAVRIRDPREDELPSVGLVTFEDPQTREQLVVDTNDAAVRERFRYVAQAQDEAISAAIGSQGVDLLTLSTEDSLLPVLSSFLRIRHYRQALAARHSGLKRSHRSTSEDRS